MEPWKLLPKDSILQETIKVPRALTIAKFGSTLHNKINSKKYAREQFRRRQTNIYKKAFKLWLNNNSNVYVVIQHSNKYFIFNSSKYSLTWPPKEEDLVENKQYHYGKRLIPSKRRPILYQIKKAHGTSKTQRTNHALSQNWV